MLEINSVQVEQELTEKAPKRDSVIREQTITVMEVRELATDIRLAEKEEHSPVPVPVREMELSIAEKLETSAEDFISVLTMPSYQGKRNLSRFYPGTKITVL